MNDQKTESVGAQLKAARLRQRRKFESIESATRIRSRHLRALEEDQYADLPAFAYSIGFLRSYARHLRLDGEKLAAQFKNEYSLTEAKPHLHFPEPIEDSRFPARSLLALTAAVIGIAYFGWFHNFAQTNITENRVMPLPQHLSALVESPAEQPEAQQAAYSEMALNSRAPEAENDPAAATKTASPAPEREIINGQPEEKKTVIVRTSFESMAPASLLPVRSPERPAEDLPGAASRILLRATEDVWVRITGRNDQVILDHVLAAGESYFPPALDGLSLTTSNAGALAIHVDGEPMRNLGARGGIVRNIALDPERLRMGAAVATKLGALR